MTARPRVVVAGLGDSGLLTAVRLSKRCDVVGISSKPALVSGQELGVRLARPDDWARDYWITFDRYRRLDGTRQVHGSLTGVDLEARQVGVELPDGTTQQEPYDVLVISTGVRNGFWRQPTLETHDDVDAGIREVHERLAAAGSVMVVGGGASAVSTAANIAQQWPDTQVDLYFPGEHALPLHHRTVWGHVEKRLEELGVRRHPGHRADVPDGFELDRLTDDPVTWSTGQPPATADAVVWAIGRTRPNTGWLPAELLDDDGFVVVTPELRVPGHDGVYAVGDVAATDPMRGSARNRADRLLAHNVLADLDGKPVKTYRAPHRRWGAVLGGQPDGLTVYSTKGKPVRFPEWSNRLVVRPWLVGRGIYLGIRRDRRVS